VICSETFTDPPFTLTTTKRIAYQWPTFSDEMADDIRKGRLDYTPSVEAAVGLGQLLTHHKHTPA